MGGSVVNVPNFLGMLRVALIPLYVFLVHEAGQAPLGPPMENLRMAALATLLLSGFTDVLDGYAARRMGLESPFGAVLDAVADKLTQVSGLAVLIWAGPPAFPDLPLWLLGAVVIRDGVLATRFVLLRRRDAQDVEHQLHGKAATVLVFLVLLAATASAPGDVVLPVAVLAAATSLLSAGAYALRGARAAGLL